MEHQFELTANVPLTPYDSPFPGGHTPGRDEGRLQLQELMTMCTKLLKQVLDLEKEKDAQAFESSDDDLDEEDASKQGRGSDKIKPILCNFTLCLWMLEAEEESIWNLSLSSSSNQRLKSSKMFEYILLMTEKLKLKKLDD
ncbi:hypothetical protein Tco_1364665 [Tanacetum coccineum]